MDFPFTDHPFAVGQRVWLDGDLSTVVGIGVTHMRAAPLAQVFVLCTTPDGAGRRLFKLTGNELYDLEAAA